MAKIIADNVMETGTVSGLDNVVLTGAVPGFRAFADVAVDGDTFDYTIAVVNSAFVRTGQFETGSGTLTSGELVRTRVDASSSDDAMVVFDAGIKIVMLTYNANSILGITELGNFGPPSGSNAPAYPGGFAAYVNVTEPIEITHIVIDMVDAISACNAIPVIYTALASDQAGDLLAQGGTTSDLVAGENVLQLDTPYTAQPGEVLWLTVFMNDDNAPNIATMGGDAYSAALAGLTEPSGSPGGTLLSLSGGALRIFGRGLEAELVGIAPALYKLSEHTQLSGGYQLGTSVEIVPGYDSLVVEITGRCNEAGVDEIGFGLSFFTMSGAANIDFQAIKVVDTTVTGVAVADVANETTEILGTPAATAPADLMCSYIIEVPNYMGEQHKRFNVSGGFRSDAGTAAMTHYTGSGEVRSTEPITGVQAWLTSSAWVDGSRIVIYGRGG